MPFTLGSLYFLQMPIYFKFCVEVHLKKFQFWKQTGKIQKPLHKFFYYVFIIFILSKFALICFCAAWMQKMYSLCKHSDLQQLRKG